MNIRNFRGQGASSAILAIFCARLHNRHFAFKPFFNRVRFTFIKKSGEPRKRIILQPTSIMNIKPLALCSVFLASFLCHTSQAALLIEETFNYTVGSNIGASPATGTGLTGNWQRGFSDTATATISTFSTTWNTPTGYGFTASGNAIGTPVDSTNSGAVNFAPGVGINFDADGSYYYSYLLNYTGSDFRSRVSFGTSASPDLMRVQGLTDGTLRAYAGGSFGAGGAFAAGQYLVIGRITAVSSGSDENRIWVYGSSDSIALSDPGTVGSYAAFSAVTTGTANMLQFNNMIDAQVGDFRLGTTWEAVAVPEPSSVALAMGLCVLLFAGRRLYTAKRKQ